MPQPRNQRPGPAGPSSDDRAGTAAADGHMGADPEATTPWPPHGRKALPWRTNPDARDRSGRRPPREDRLLTEITVSIPALISELDPPMGTATVTLLEEAAAAVTDLDQRSGPSPSLSALEGLLLRSESVASSKIEHVNADRDELARAMAGHEAGREARQIVGAAAALWALIDAAGLRPITVDLINDAHRQLLDSDRFEHDAAGQLREVQNWLGGSDHSPRGALYVPPPPELVPELMADLARTAQRTDLPALAQAALVHAQFESIHPYTDGNGRIGRALINAVFRRRRLTSTTVVPVASVMLADTDRYFSLLDTYGAGDAEGFVRYTAEAVSVACSASRITADALDLLPAQWMEAVRPRKGSTAETLLRRLLSSPVLDGRSAAALAQASRRRAYDGLDRLTEAGVLTEITGGARDRVWVAEDVFDELDRLDERIGKRAAPATPLWR